MDPHLEVSALMILPHHIVLKNAPSLYSLSLDGHDLHISGSMTDGGSNYCSPRYVLLDLIATPSQFGCTHDCLCSNYTKTAPGFPKTSFNSNLVTGGYNFSVGDIEVFAVKLKKK